MSKIIFFMFAGRTENMEVQRPHVERLLADYPEAEFHLWDLTRVASDQTYIRRWAESHDRIVYYGGFHPGHPMRCLGPRRRGAPPCRCMKHTPPYERVWHHYANDHHYGADTTFVKFDDDVVWMDTRRFGEVLEFLETHPNEVASANVANNAVCAKYQRGLREALMEEFGLGDPDDPANDRDWWALHTDSCFAWLSHHWLLDTLLHRVGGYPWRAPFKTREGEAISINFVAMKHLTLQRVAAKMNGRLGDEGAVDTELPWIIPNFRVAHLSFGPQESGMGVSLPALRRQYSNENLPVTPVIHV